MIDKAAQFRQIIANKYLVYNSLFLNLPHESTAHTGIFIPLLQQLSVKGYAQAASPSSIMEHFFEQHTQLKTWEEKFNLLFRMVQYIERQVVLFDCVEDASFSQFNKQQLLQLFQAKDADNSTLAQHLKEASIRLVFTAHPTQFYSSDVQTVMHGLREAIKQDNIGQIDTLLQQLAFTPFINRNKPTPLDEAQNIINYLRYVYYDAFGKLYHNLATALREKPDFNPRLLEMGFWPGGDRDGNPFVTAKVTLQVAQLLKRTILKCYYNHLKQLKRKITFKETAPILLEIKNSLYNYLFQQSGDFSLEKLLGALNAVKKLLNERYENMYLADLNDLIGRIHLFGVHFAALDIRQDSSVHREMMAHIMAEKGIPNFLQMPAQNQIELLENMPMQLKAETFENPLFADTISNIKQIRVIQASNGMRGLHRYIVSNTETALDIMYVYYFFIGCGYNLSEIAIDFVPLFETMIGMANAEQVMRQLYQNKQYAGHLQERNNQQTIMLGFSDGTKDGGYLKANWEINQTKERLSKQATMLGYDVTFFDGRGGPPARGGGKTHQFYASQSPEISGKNLQLTIQGQTITSVYGSKEQATYHLEQLLLAGKKARWNNQQLSQEHQALMQQLADLSYEHYQKLKNSPHFIPYLTEMTTLKYYGETNIGSRPSKRNSGKAFSFKDLRAIPFVGSWALIRQNVPGYYGLGTAMASFEKNPEVLEELYAQSAFFRSLIQNSIMSMKKSYFPLTASMAEHPKFGGFWQQLRTEYLLTKKWALHLTKQTSLMENEPLARLSVSMREKIILPLLTIQQFSLAMIEQNHAQKATFEKLVIRSLFGNINASRNSA